MKRLKKWWKRQENPSHLHNVGDVLEAVEAGKAFKRDYESNIELHPEADKGAVKKACLDFHAKKLILSWRSKAKIQKVMNAVEDMGVIAHRRDDGHCLVAYSYAFALCKRSVEIYDTDCEEDEDAFYRYVKRSLEENHSGE